MRCVLVAISSSVKPVVSDADGHHTCATSDVQAFERRRCPLMLREMPRRASKGRDKKPVNRWPSLLLRQQPAVSLNM